MKTPIDATGHPGATVALLNGGQPFCTVGLWAITLNGGTVIYLHDGPMNSSLTFNGTTYLAGAPMERGKITTKLGVEVATMDARFIANSADLINGVPIIPFAVGRGFDGATVQLLKAFLPSWQSPITGCVIDFSGRVTEIKDIGRSEFTMTISAWTVLLNVNMGPDVFQAGCLNTLFDSSCTLSAASFKTSSSVSGTGTVNGCNTALTQADGYFTQGRIVFKTGANAGLARAVSSYANASGALTFAFPLPNAPANGDTFDIYAGCPLTTAICTSRFANLIHFRGQPFTPPAITGSIG